MLQKLKQEETANLNCRLLKKYIIKKLDTKNNSVQKASLVIQIVKEKLIPILISTREQK